MQITKLSELNKFFEIVKHDLWRCSIIKVFTFGSDVSSVKSFNYLIDDKLYILMDNFFAFIIEYSDACNINIEYRKLTTEELEASAKITCRDFFNRVEEIYNIKNYRMNRRESCLLEYSEIKEIKVNYLNEKHLICKNNSSIEQKKTEEEFDEIQFIMYNGNIIHLWPEDATSDGYLNVWATGTIEKYKEFVSTDNIKFNNYKDADEFRDFLHTKVGMKMMSEIAYLMRHSKDDKKNNPDEVKNNN